MFVQKLCEVERKEYVRGGEFSGWGSEGFGELGSILLEMVFYASYDRRPPEVSHFY